MKEKTTKVILGMLGIILTCTMVAWATSIHCDIDYNSGSKPAEIIGSGPYSVKFISWGAQKSHPGCWATLPANQQNITAQGGLNGNYEYVYDGSGMKNVLTLNVDKVTGGNPNSIRVRWK